MRNTCYKILKDFEANGTYLNLAIKNLEGDAQSIAAIAVRVYGIVQNNELLDYLVSELTEKKTIDKNVRLILKMQIFEYRFLDKPDYVCVNEGVNLAKKYTKSASGFINANLRNLETIKDKYPTFANEEKNISIKYSHPRFIVKKLIKQYPDDYIQILESNTNEKDTFVRIVNNLVVPNDFEIIEPFTDLAKYTNKAIVKHPDFINGNVVIQDLGSYLVGKLVDAQSDETVLDLCAAPGNKTMHIAKTAKLVVANELHSHRAQLINDNIAKFKLSNIEVINSDAQSFDEISNNLKQNSSPMLFDKVLIDTPCSGWGVIKSKPEIKYNHSQQDIDNITCVSHNIISNGLKFLKPNGQLIFSTCTLNRDENDYLIKQICEQHNLREVKESSLEQFTKNQMELGICLKNYTYNSDSFYMIKLEKND